MQRALKFLFTNWAMKSLRSEQETVVKDVFAACYGKSCYACLPYTFDNREAKKDRLL